MKRGAVEGVATVPAHVVIVLFVRGVDDKAGNSEAHVELDESSSSKTDAVLSVVLLTATRRPLWTTVKLSEL
ncbi:MAG: hypothetical protein ACYDHP_14130 [Ferrimicrobium sp.]